MSNSILVHIGRFIVLILAQSLLLNNINFLGYLNPYIYIIFILLAPININRSLFLITSFFLGLCIDILGDSGGVHAAACLVATYVRPFILRTAFGLSYEFQTVKLSKLRFGERFMYVTLTVVVHHLVLFSLEVFNFMHILIILKKALFTSLFTILMTMLILVLFRKNDT
ncbi:rod shape-determining protein MreD [Aquimarina sp. 2-A2]|uniref:Rod shape-determining protein MreD n=1 Tax=Aquimarina intermedia TaxID=350814 RepID=A0A5S5CC57_9FLAO|nr:rod shape-determining protein MreD [Aquimarina intermedia]TYP76082.1 rod shape-determining protein MreD [Aquimarina intermedia]